MTSSLLIGRWRAESGPEAMQADQALLEATESGSIQARLHGWSVPTLTYGKAQRLSEPQLDELRRAEIEPTRRPTGGGWLIHLPGDLALTMALGGPLKSGELRSMTRRTAQWIAAALGDRGMAGRIVDADPRARSRSDGCFMRTDRDELTVAGAKVAGIALARIRGSALVQAAIPIVPFASSCDDVPRRWDPLRVDGVRALAGLTAEQLAESLQKVAGDVLA